MRRLLFVAPLLLSACASQEIPPARARHFSPGAEARAVVAAPTWILRPPSRPGYRYFVGESTGAGERDSALEKAWANAFVRIGMAEFPELAEVSAKSVEGLKTATYERRFVMRLEHVDWTGVREATELGSPFVDRSRTGAFVVYRLLYWPDTRIRAAHAKLKLAAIHPLPTPPEARQRDEKKLAEAVRAMQAVNAKVESKNRMYDKVFGELKCGVSLDDVMRILGGPDRFNPYNGMIVDKEYYWGLYRVERYADNPVITAVTKEDGASARRVICPGIVPQD